MSDDPVWQVDRLRRRWQADPAVSAKLCSVFDDIGFDQAFVETTAASTGKRKYLKDNVWGMIEFDHASIQLIDSPLLQRLRGVRQLGFSNLVYPSAEHTRFVHSLGMAHVVASFAASIRRNANTHVEGSAQVDRYRDMDALLPLTERELIFAALLHDIGHLPFSHACEAALSQKDRAFTCGGAPLGDFLTEARFAFGKDISLSESLSILIVLSERFEGFYRRLASAGADDASASLVRIACLIAGVPATPACPNIQDLISAAAVDADKIDYVTRDAAACGIAVGVDVSRIFMGSGLVNARLDAYEDLYEGNETGTLFVVNSSGADTLDEIVQARSALYQRVYLHPVTRTAEALFARALHLNASAADLCQPDLVDALDLWAMDDASLIRSLSEHKCLSIKALAHRLRRRTLPKKACALAGSVAAMQMPLRSIFPHLDPTAASSIRKDLANAFIEKLRRENIGDIGISQIEHHIKAEAESLAKALADGGHRDLVPEAALDLVVMTPIAAMDGSKPDALVFQAGEIIRTPALTNVQGQHDAQDIFKAVGYVFCDPDWRAIVLAASRRVVLDMSERLSGDLVQHSLSPSNGDSVVSAKKRTVLEFEGVTRRANIARSTAERIMNAAAEIGYFDEIPVLYSPTRITTRGVSAVARVFKSFSGDLGWAVDKTTVAAFVDQFPVRLRHDMLVMLAQGLLLDQNTIGQSLVSAISKARSGDEAVVILPLSASSGGEAVTILEQCRLANVRPCTNIGQALAVDGDPLIVLVDDNSASGVQAAAQLCAYAGIERHARPEKLKREDGLFESTLGTDDIARLRGRRLAVAVAAGLDDADAYTKEVASDFGYTAFRGVSYGTRIAEGLKWPDDLKTFLVGVGHELMAQRYARKPYADIADRDLQRRCDERSFGYGGRGGVMVTHGNVPSSTVTALWHPGLIYGRPWMPLFLRRGLREHLVLG